jgi:hypothetical protein
VCSQQQSFAARTADLFGIHFARATTSSFARVPNDLETALSIILVKPGSASEREAASATVETEQIMTPELSNFTNVRPQQ